MLFEEKHFLCAKWHKTRSVHNIKLIHSAFLCLEVLNVMVSVHTQSNWSWMDWIWVWHVTWYLQMCMHIVWFNCVYTLVLLISDCVINVVIFSFMYSVSFSFLNNASDNCWGNISLIICKLDHQFSHTQPRLVVLVWKVETRAQQICSSACSE